MSNSSFITIDSGASGNGNGTVNFTVAPNTTGVARVGTLTVAAQRNDHSGCGSDCNDDTATTDEDTPVDINVLANDSDSDGDTLNVVSVTQGANGTVSINPDKTVRYAPAANFFSTVHLYRRRRTRRHRDSNVNVTVNAVNDARCLRLTCCRKRYSTAT